MDEGASGRGGRASTGAERVAHSGTAIKGNATFSRTFRVRATAADA
jgi:hypothetical protein